MLRIAADTGVSVGQSFEGQLVQQRQKDVLRVALSRHVELVGAMRQQAAVDAEAQPAGLPGEAADLPVLPLLVDLGRHVALQRHRIAAHRQRDLQMGRLNAERIALGQVPRLQVEVEKLGLKVPALEAQFAFTDADALDREGGTEALACGPALEQRIVEDENWTVDFDVDGLFPHEQRGRRQVDVDAGERDQVVVADGKILDVVNLQAQGKEGEAQVAEADRDGAAAGNQTVDVVFCAVIGAGA